MECRFGAPPFCSVQGTDAAGRKNGAAALQNDVGRALGVRYRAVFGPVQSSHHFPLRIESDFSCTGAGLFQLRPFQAKTAGQIQKRQLRRISQAAAAVSHSIVAQGKAFQKEPVAAGVQPGGFQNPAIQVAGGHSHTVLGQRAGLVRADHTDTAQRLDAGQTLHDSIHLHHAGDA